MRAASEADVEAMLRKVGIEAEVDESNPNNQRDKRNQQLTNVSK